MTESRMQRLILAAVVAWPPPLSSGTEIKPAFAARGRRPEVGGRRSEVGKSAETTPISDL
jgi:hypothetical protein